MDFCPITKVLLTPITTGDTLKFKTSKTGTVYEAEAEHTLLAEENFNEVSSISKFSNTLSTSAYVPINPRERLEKGCRKCGRKVVSLQRLGDAKNVVYSCICGAQWSN